MFDLFGDSVILVGFFRFKSVNVFFFIFKEYVVLRVKSGVFG